MISTVNPEAPTIGTVARKRRRQILQSQRTKTGEETAELTPSSKKRCVEPITATSALSNNNDSKKSTPSTTKTKKPQMRYDPDVPMSKEEAAAWRKEQRRKRNRESAAASRQRQRDRISELEQEVSDWKMKYEDALARIEKLEQLKRSGISSNSTTDCLALSPVESAAISPCSSPRISPALTPDQSCGLVSLQDQSNCMEMEGNISCDEDQADDIHVVKHLSEQISRPA